jgi:hypothetical protein
MVGHVIPCSKCGKNFTKFSTISRESRCADCHGRGRTRGNRYAQTKKIRETSTDKVLKRIDSLEEKMELMELTLEVGENEVNYLVNEFEHRVKEILVSVVEEEITRMITDDEELATLLEKKFKLSLVKVQNNFNDRISEVSKRLTFVEQKSGYKILSDKEREAGNAPFDGKTSGSAHIEKGKIHSKKDVVVDPDTQGLTKLLTVRRKAKIKAVQNFIKQSKKGYVSISEVMNYVWHSDSLSNTQMNLTLAANEGFLRKVRDSRDLRKVQYHLPEGHEL